MVACRLIACAAASAVALFASSAASADGGLTFVINGDTFSQPFTITNTSTAGEKVLGFGISLKAPYGFDTVNTSSGGTFGIDSASPFAPNAASALATGYTGPSSIADGATNLNFTFSDFNVGEAFTWGIDIDTPSVVTVFGSDLIGSTGYADFSNGLRGLGVFEAFGGTGSQFVITSVTPTPAVPEPATWAMMLAGFGLIGGGLRRRQRQAVRVTFA